MRKKVLLLAVSCKNGGLCPGGVDLSDPSRWIRIVKDDGQSGPVQGKDIDFASPLDIIEFDGHPAPHGKQLENWVIDNHSCKNLGRAQLSGSSDVKDLLHWAYRAYSYKEFWGNIKAYLTEEEFENINVPTESIMRVKQLRIYKNSNRKVKSDFNWYRSRHRILGISTTDQEFYSIEDGEEVNIDDAYIVVSIPSSPWFNPSTGLKHSYKFISKIFDL